METNPLVTNFDPQFLKNGILTHENGVVRGSLQNIFEKTGVSNKIELINKLILEKNAH